MRVIPSCHPEAKHQAKGLCTACYMRVWAKSHKTSSAMSVKIPEGFYTYLWLREDSTPYYVGKGKGRRAYTSFSHGVHKPKHASRILVQCWESEEKAFEMEKWYISFYGRRDNGTGILRNLSDGGEGPAGAVSSKRGTRLSQDTKAKVSATLKRKGIVPPSRKGVPHTQEVKDRIAASMRILRRTQRGQ